MSFDKKALLADLERLIDHPDTPAAEKENALERVREIELRLSKAMVKNKKKPGIASLAGRSPKVTGIIKVRWPFGWDGPCVRVDYQFVPIGEGGELSWGCPGCGNRVAEDIRGRLLRRLLGRPGGVSRWIGDRARGAINQLCNACWDKHEG